MKAGILKGAVKIYAELEGLRFPALLIEKAYSQLANIIKDPPIGIRRLATRKAGERLAESLKNFIMERYKMEIKREDVPQIIQAFFQSCGFGDVSWDFDGEILKIQVRDSFILRSHQDPEVGLGQLIGIMEGFVSKLLDKEVTGKVEGQSYIFVIKS